jgi:hypothetical protein
MPAYDLSPATLARVANQEVDLLRIAGVDVWAKPTADGPYYVTGYSAVTPNNFTDGTPNISTAHLCIFHNSGYVTGIQWYDANAASGNWALRLWEAIADDGHIPAISSPSLANVTVASAGSGWRETNFASPVAVVPGQMYVVSRYSSVGHYCHLSLPEDSFGGYTDGDPPYIPQANEDLSFIVTGWSSADRSIYQIAGGDVIPRTTGFAQPFYGVAPIFYKTL